MNASARYSDNGFWSCFCCCCTVKGTYDESDPEQPTMTVGNNILKKQPHKQSDDIF